MEFLILLAAGILAGAINSLAGGGSFVLFPSLLLVGVPPVMANATNSFAALPGYISGAIGFWNDIKKHKEKILPYSIFAFIGGFLGAELLLQVSDEQFSIIVPYLMAIAVFLFAFGNKINSWVSSYADKAISSKRIFSIFLFFLLLLICIYGGFFNAGLGIILLAFFALSGLQNIHTMNGIKLLLSSIVSLIAVVRFALAGSIAWQEGLTAFAGTLMGGYLAARLMHFLPPSILRMLIIIYGIILVIIFFQQAYFS